MWGLPQLGRWKWHDPWVHADLLAANNSRIWVWSPKTGGASDPAAMIARTGEAITQAFTELHNLDASGIRQQRRQKFLDIGRKLG